MISRNQRALILVGVSVGILLASLRCPATAIRAGEDPVLVEAQRVYKLTLSTADFLFTAEDQNELLIEAAIPGTHAVVEKLRLKARQWLPVLLRAIDAYVLAKNDKTTSELMTAHTVVESILADVQRTIATMPTMPAPISLPTPTPGGPK